MLVRCEFCHQEVELGALPIHERWCKISPEARSDDWWTRRFGL
jgi:hypothetical protein